MNGPCRCRLQSADSRHSVLGGQRALSAKKISSPEKRNIHNRSRKLLDGSHFIDYPAAKSRVPPVSRGFVLYRVSPRGTMATLVMRGYSAPDLDSPLQYFAVVIPDRYKPGRESLCGIEQTRQLFRDVGAPSSTPSRYDRTARSVA